MTEENKDDKSIFEEADVQEELPSEEQVPEQEEETGEFSPTISKESPKAKLERMGEKKEVDGRVLTIKEVGFTRPRTTKADGSPETPKKTQDGQKEYYPGKLKVKFEEENLVEYYPSFHYFVNDGVVSKFAKINRGGDNVITKLFKLAIAKIGKPVDEVSDQEFYEWLVGKKTKMKTEKGTYMKKNWFRNDITAFVD